MPNKTKQLNPEERLQASVARDVKLRILEDHARNQANAVLVAQWENALSEKDVGAARKRQDSQIFEDSNVAKVSNTVLRRQRLEELYKYDEMRFEQELNARGLAFRKEKC